MATSGSVPFLQPVILLPFHRPSCFAESCLVSFWFEFVCSNTFLHNNNSNNLRIKCFLINVIECFWFLCEPNSKHSMQDSHYLSVKWQIF